MANYARIVQAIADAANAWLPEGYVLGYRLPHDVPLAADDPAYASTPEDPAHLALHGGLVLAEMRRDLERYRARHPGRVDDGDLSALPATGAYLVVEILHRPTGIVAVRAYDWTTIRGLILDPSRTPAQKRAAIRAAIQSLADACAARVAAAGWTP